MSRLTEKVLAFIDTETTGLDPTIHEIIEYAIIKEHPDGHLETYSIKAKPNHIETADPKALDVNGYTPEAWQDALTQAEAAQKVGALLEKCVLIGHNVPFDVGFIKETLKREGVPTQRIGTLCVDTMTLAWEHLAPIGLESMSLKGVCEFLGIDPEPAKHEALNGALKDRAVYSRLLRATQGMRNFWEEAKLKQTSFQ